MKWKIYFWIYLVLGIAGFLISPPLMAEQPAFVVIEGTIESILLILAAGTYAYGKKIFQPVFWKFIFGAVLVIWFLQILAGIADISQLDFLRANFSLGTTLFSMIISIPAVIAMYRLGKGK